MAAFPRSRFWRFSLRIYRRAKAAAACLALQDRLGLDVNLLLYCLWRASRDRAPIGAREMAALVAAVNPWQSEVIIPLRRLRRGLKAVLGRDPALPLAPAIAVFREQVKRLELEAEHLQQVMLEAMSEPGVGRGHESRAIHTIARQNFGIYLRTVRRKASRADEGALAILLRALKSARRPRQTTRRGATRRRAMRLRREA